MTTVQILAEKLKSQSDNASTAAAKAQSAADAAQSAASAALEIDSAGNEWIRLKNGIQICRGKKYLSGTITSTSNPVTFPVAFAATPCTYMACDANIGNPGMVGWQTATGFVCGAYDGGSGTASWLAIGRWK